jgi:sugar phosphate isomerase/epimerase
LGEGEINVSVAIQALKDADYPGTWCLEYEGKEGSAGYAKSLERLKALV